MSQTQGDAPPAGRLTAPALPRLAALAIDGATYLIIPALLLPVGLLLIQRGVVLSGGIGIQGGASMAILYGSPRASRESPAGRSATTTAKSLHPLLGTWIFLTPEEVTSVTRGDLRSIDRSDSGLMTAIAVELDKEIQCL